MNPVPLIALLLIVSQAVPPEGGDGPEVHVTAAVSDSLRLSLEVPDRIATGEPVSMILRVENISGRALELYLRGRTVAFNLIVTGPDGGELWSLLHGGMIPAILRLETLAPGAALVLPATWDQRSNMGRPVPPGTYGVRAELLTEGEPLRTPSREVRIP